MHTRPISLACSTPAPDAFAHAVFVGSEPGMRATMAPGPADVVLRSNSRSTADART